MSERSVVLTPEANWFVDNCELMLRQMGLGSAGVELVAAHVIQLLWIAVPKAAFLNQPRYCGPDPDRPGFSIFEFREAFVAGKYTSTPESVCVLVIELNVANILSCLANEDRASLRRPHNGRARP